MKSWFKKLSEWLTPEIQEIIRENDRQKDEVKRIINDWGEDLKKTLNPRVID